MSVTLRRGKGSKLTHNELDDNFAPEYTISTITVGQFLKAGTPWSLAQADAEANLCDGVAIRVNGSAVSVLTVDGSVFDWPGHPFSPGDLLYLDQSTPGGATATKPQVGYRQPVAKVIDATEIIFRLGPWEFV